MTVDIVCSTLWRPQHLEPFLRSVEDHTSDYTVLFVCQHDDAATLAELHRLNADWITVEGNPATAVQKINAGYRATASEFFYIATDDTRMTDGWLEAALAAMTADVDVVGINDGIEAHRRGGDLPGHFLIRRGYIRDHSGVRDEYDVVCHEGYRHYYADLELWDTAKSRGVSASAFDSRIEHLHPNAGYPADKTNEWAWSYRQADLALYEGRQFLFDRTWVHPRTVSDR